MYVYDKCHVINEVDVLLVVLMSLMSPTSSFVVDLSLYNNSDIISYYSVRRGIMYYRGQSIVEMETGLGVHSLGTMHL